MSRMDPVQIATSTSSMSEADATNERDIQLWLKMGRAAFFFCVWSAMVIPIALIYDARF